MDPFLENDKLWPSFQHQLVHCLYQILLPGLMDHYRARVNQRHYVSEQVLFTSVVREEHLEQFIEIRQRKDGKLITCLEVVSPGNKLTSAGGDAYREKRREARSQHANLVEIDLIMQGVSLQDYSKDVLADCDYAVTVTRAAQAERFEIYKATLQKRLPRFRLPLASDDRDTVVDLQAAFTRAFDQGNFAAQIDYQRDPHIALTDLNRTWIDERLRDSNVRN